MSQYPYGYSQYPAPPPHQQQYHYQTPMPYQPPAGYPPPPSPVDHQQQHYAISQGSYEYNASSIPGLAPGAPANNPISGPPPYGLASANSWGQPPPQQYSDQQQAGYSSLQQQQQQQQQHHHLHQQQPPPLNYHQTPVSYPPHAPPPPSLPVLPPQLSQPPPLEDQHQASASYPAMPVEDAELSEGDFENLYEPHDPEKEVQRMCQEQERQKQRDREALKGSTSGKGQATNKGTGGTILDQDIANDLNNDGSLYASGSEAGEVSAASNGQNAPSLRGPSSTSVKVNVGPIQTSTSEKPVNAPEESVSYSPYLPPRASQSHSKPPHPTKHRVTTAANQNATKTTIPTMPPRPGPLSGNMKIPGMSYFTSNRSAGEHKSNSCSRLAVKENIVNPKNVPGLGVTQITSTLELGSQPPREDSDAPTTNQAAAVSKQDMKNKAKTAILSLWPTVRYHQYVENGINPETLKSLFGELGLDTDSPPPNQLGGGPAVVNAHIASAALGEDVEMSKPSSKTEPAVTTTTIRAASTDDKAEARKDRIARLLAMKKGRTSTQSEQPGSQSSSQAAPAKVVEVAGTGSEPSSVPDTSGLGSRSKPTCEKDVLLQKKLDALEKSRAVRAQKDAERKNSTQAQTQTTTEDPPTPAVVTVGDDAASPKIPSLIPGLVISSAPAPSLTQRKRPVASDFDSEIPSTRAKRPFRSPPNDYVPPQDISDNEDVEMDLGSPTEVLSLSISHSIPAPNGAGQSGDLFSLPSGRQCASPTSLAGTPPISGITTPKNVQGDLDRNARAIEDLKKRIAEAEAKKASQGKLPKKPILVDALKSATPVPALAGVALLPASSPPITRSGSEAREGKEKEGQDGPSAQLLAESAESQSIQLPKRSRVARDPSAHQRRERIASIQLPQLEHIVQEKMNKVKSLERELSKLRFELQNSCDEKTRLMEEVNRLNDEPDDEPDEEGQAIGEETQENFQDSPRPTPASNSGPTSPSGETQPEQQIEPVTMNRPEGNVGCVQSSPAESHLEQQAEPPSIKKPEGDVPNVQSAPEVDMAYTPVTPDHGGAESRSPLASPTTLTALSAHVGPCDDSARRTALNDSSKAPEEHFLDGPKVLLGAPKVSPIAAGAVHVGRTHGDIEMEDAGSPPGQQMNGKPSPRSQVVQEAQPESAETVIPAAVEENSGVTGELEYIEMDDSIVMPQKISAGGLEAEASDGELTGGLMEPPDQIVLSQDSTSFVPYESPLAMFKSFRFHPKFKEAVPGGLKSVTYSNKIDPCKEFCTKELMEGSCGEGSSCPFQHMKSIVAPEDLILLELGSSDVYTGERKSKFTQGLRGLLTELKISKVKNFDVIANAIIDYRARFNGDPSKVLPLEGVEI